MQMTETHKTRRSLSDRQINRLIIGIIVVLVIGIPLIGVIYFLDRNVDAGPSMAQRAITTAEEAVRKEPNNIQARLSLGSSYFQSERYQDAVSQFTEVLKVAPDHSGALIGRGNAYLALKDDADAQKDFQKAADGLVAAGAAVGNPQLGEAYFRLGQIAFRAGRYDDAVESEKSAIALDQGDADAMAVLGAALLKTGRAADAIPVLKSAISFVPSGWCDPYQSLADAYATTGDADGATYANAMVAFCQGDVATAKAGLNPLTSGALAVDALLGLGQIAEQTGDAEAAKDAYTRVLAKDPQNANAIFGMQRIGASASNDPHVGVPAAGSPPPAASPTAGANP